MSSENSPSDRDRRYEQARERRNEALERLRRRVAQLQPRARVLIVDDQRSVAETLAMSIRVQTGAEVQVETDPESALALAKRTKQGEFAVAIVDLHLEHAEITGLTIAEELLPRGVGIVLITGAVPEVIHDCAMRVSAFDTLTKPPSEQDLQRVCTEIKRRIRPSTSLPERASSPA